MTTAEFDALIKNLSGAAREKAILDAFASGSAPSWFDDQKQWVPVALSPRTTIFVTPDYASIGDRRVTMTPFSAQRLATQRHAILPTRKLVNAIYQAAHTKLPSKPFPPDANMEKSFRMADHDAAIGPQKPSKTNLIAGHKKDIVVGPDLDGSRVAIYGWQPDPKTFPHQPYSTVHDASYADYSHGVRLVSRWVQLDGKPMDIYELFKSPELALLVSDQGSFVPVFPNKGASWSGKATGGPSGAVAGAIAGAAIGGPIGAVIGGVVGAVSDDRKK